MLPPNECLVLTDFQVFFQPVRRCSTPFHISKCQVHENAQACDRENGASAIKGESAGNRGDHLAMEPKTRNLQLEERNLLRRATNVKSAALPNAPPFMPNAVFACPLVRAGETQADRFSRAGIYHKSTGHSNKAGRLDPVDNQFTIPYKDCLAGFGGLAMKHNFLSNF